MFHDFSLINEQIKITASYHGVMMSAIKIFWVLIDQRVAKLRLQILAILNAIFTGFRFFLGRQFNFFLVKPL